MGMGSRSVGWLGGGCRYGMGARQSAGPPPPLGFPVGHQKVEQGSLAIPPFLKVLRVRGGGRRGGAGDREEAGVPQGQGERKRKAWQAEHRARQQRNLSDPTWPGLDVSCDKYA